MLRSIVRSAQLKRSIATQVSSRAEITELSNGLVVATEHIPNTQSASVGFVFGSGASAENPFNNGVCSVLSNAFKSTHGADAAKKGYGLSSVVDREFQSYIVDTPAGKSEHALEFLQSKLFTPLSESAFAEARSKAISEAQAVELNNPAERVMEHLHATAFQNTPLSLPKKGTVESLSDLAKVDIESFAKKHFLTSNTVVVGAGNISHQELVKAVESQSRLASGNKPESTKNSSFLGSDVRLRDDTLPSAWISIAAEGEPIGSPNYYVAKVAAQIFGSYIHSEPASKLQGIKLLDHVKEYHLADSFEHFSHSYKDSGLWGFSTVTSNIYQIDDLIHFTLKQWNRLSISITETEVARGKALLKLHLASEASSSSAIATGLGANALALNGAPLSLTQAFAKIDAITAKDVKKWAGERLWDQDIAIAATGQIEGLLDYMRMRNDMSMMRW